MLARVDRRVGQLVWSSAALILLGHSFRQIALGEALDPARMLLPGVTSLLLLTSATLSMVLPLRVLRTAWLLLAAVGLALHPWTIGEGREGCFDTPDPTVWTLNAALAASLSLSLPPALGMLSTVPAGVLSAAGAMAACSSPGPEALTLVPQQILILAFVASVTWLRIAWCRSLQSERVRLLHAHRRRIAEIRAQERRRIHRFVHDRILAVLGAAAQTDGRFSTAVRKEADRSIRALHTGRIGSAPPETLRLRPLLALASGLGLAARVVHDEGRSRIPPSAAEALSLAAAEAIRNCARHADDPDGGTVLVEQRPDRVTITITDRGRGFDPRKVAEDRLGVTQSILARVDEQQGCRARLHSAPGAGTTIELIWEDQGAEQR